MRQRSISRLSLAIIATLLFAGCGDDDQKAETKKAPRPTTSTTEAPTTTSTTVALASTAAQPNVRVYFIRDGKLAAAGREVPPPAVAQGALEQLFLGLSTLERDGGLSTTFPPEAALRSVNVANNVATIDVSAATMANADAAQRNLRAAQIVATATQFPTITSVTLLVEGQPVDGLPAFLSRALFEGVSPSVLLESPTFGQTVKSPVRLTGTANTYEAEFMVRIVGSNNKVLFEDFVMATSGSGTRGTFRRDVTFNAGALTSGKVIVYEISADDGSETHKVEVPVNFAS